MATVIILISAHCWHKVIGRLSDAQGLCAQGPHNLINDTVLLCFFGVKILVAVEVKLDLHSTRESSDQPHFHACTHDM
jgi:hypothetical protein